MTSTFLSSRSGLAKSIISNRTNLSLLSFRHLRLRRSVTQQTHLYRLPAGSTIGIRGMAIHSVAQQGFSEGTNEVYDRARPSYQPSVLSYIRRSIPQEQSTPLNIVEIGSGTGIFTRALLAHPDWSSSVAEIRAVEPSAGMRAQFNKTVTAPDQVKISVQEGSFTSTNIESGWADLVIMAQAYHWAHPNYDEASIEFARILKPSGAVVYLWNMEDIQSTTSPWVKSARPLYEQYEAGSPQYRLGLWRATFDPAVSPKYPTLFEQPSEETFDWVIPTTQEAVLDRIHSKSYIAILEKENREEYENLIEKVKEILGKNEKKWIDKNAGVFEYPYKTTVLIARKK